MAAENKKLAAEVKRFEEKQRINDSLRKNAATADIQQHRRIVEYGQQFTYLWGT